MLHINKQYHQITTNMDWKNAFSVLYEYQAVFWIMAIGYLTHWLSYNLKEKIETTFIKSHFIIKALAAVVTGIVCYQTYAADFQPFIYFQF